MKLVKMSLAAAVLLGASAFAIDNVKVSGDAKVYYSTTDAGVEDMFDKTNSAADTALRVGVTGDLLKGVSFGLTGNAVSTLGLDNNLVSATWSGSHNGVEDAAWMSEAWLATTMGKTTVKIGRMELDTPLAFSESWSVAKNTFDAAVLINQDIPDTTVVGAWVGKGNGVNHLSPLAGSAFYPLAVSNTSGGLDGYSGAGADFVTYGDSGAYALAVVNNSFKPLTAQAWYYNVSNVADAFWLQGDIDCQLVKGLKIGAQYASISPSGPIEAAENSSAYAFKLGYEGIQNLKVSVAYSDTDQDGVLKVANTATNNLVAAQSKLYTEAWWNYGYVSNADAQSWNVTAEYAAPVAKFGAYYTNVSIGDATSALQSAVGAYNNIDMTELALTASKSFGPLDATLAYINTDVTGQDDANIIQAYLTLNF